MKTNPAVPLHAVPLPTSPVDQSKARDLAFRRIGVLSFDLLWHSRDSTCWHSGAARAVAGKAGSSQHEVQSASREKELEIEEVFKHSALLPMTHFLQQGCAS